VHCPSFHLFAFQSLKIIETALARYLALKLFEAVKRHAGSVGTEVNAVNELVSFAVQETCVLVSLEDLACMFQEKDLLVGIHRLKQGF
jgi:hypothetical protein